MIKIMYNKDIGKKKKNNLKIEYLVSINKKKIYEN